MKTRIHAIILFLTLSSYNLAAADEDADSEFPCGVVPKRLITKGEFFNRIQGGWEARPHSLPWQVRLFMKDPLGRGLSACGGTLVESGLKNGSDLVITAAHCLAARDWKYKYLTPEYITAVVGAHDLTLKNEPNRYAVPIFKVVGHKWFNQMKANHDIAMLKLAAVVPYTEATRPACLPKYNQPLPYGVQCVASGWGLLRYDKEHGSPKLMMRTAVIDKHENCFFPHDPRRNLCTKGHGDNCRGDSGGPLVCPINDRYTLFGVVSYGTKECTDTMFASVPNYIRWLKRNKVAADAGLEFYKLLIKSILSQMQKEEEKMEVD